MRYLTLVLFVFLLSGCSKPIEEIETPKTKVVTIDGCEYLMWKGHNDYNLVHKGNCKNHAAGTSQQ